LTEIVGGPIPIATSVASFLKGVLLLLLYKCMYMGVFIRINSDENLSCFVQDRPFPGEVTSP